MKLNYESSVVIDFLGIDLIGRQRHDVIGVVFLAVKSVNRDWCFSVRLQYVYSVP